MDGFAAAILPLRRYADFGGRSRRTELLLFYLLTMVVQLVIGFAAMPVGVRAADTISFVVWLALMCPAAALAVRRVHDVGFSGWWLLPMVPAACAGLWENFERLRDPMAQPFELPLALEIPLGLYALGLIVLLLWDDREGTNRYGPNPRHGEVGAAP